MYKKNKIRFIYLIVLLFTQTIFFYNISFADLSIGGTLQSLLNLVEENDPIDEIFNGKINTDSIYNKFLKSLDQKEIKKTTDVLESIKFNSNGLDIDPNDLLNILYDSDEKFKLGINNKLGKEDIISQKEIVKSYENLRKTLAEAGILANTNNNTKNNEVIKKWANTQFSLRYENYEYIYIISNVGKGKDLFFNGIEKDSDYDLQIDIKDVGDLLFESFIPPLETAFYSLPSIKKNSAKGSNKSSIKSDLQKIISQATQQTQNETSSINIETITNPTNNSTSSSGNYVNSSSTKQNSNSTEQSEFYTQDSDLSSFIEQNKFTQKIGSTTQTIQGDICKDEIIINIPKIEKEEYTQEEVEEYLESFFEQVEEYEILNPENSIIENINTSLLQQFGSIGAIGNIGSTPSDGDIDNYIDIILDFEESESCFSNCEGLPLSDKTICQIQCLCSSVGRPQYEDYRLKNINDTIIIRHCMVPVQNMEVPKGSLIYSFDDVLTRIHSIINNLVNGGQMTKYQKATEYMNSPLSDIEFSKILSFQVNISSKPMFSNQPSHTKQDKITTKKDNIINQSEYENSLENAKKQLNNNKYVVVAKTKNIGLEPTKEIQQLGEKLISDIDESKIEMLISLSEFLSNNYEFRNGIQENLENINNMVYSLNSQF